jgi:magnesium-transporting ATPase (P-type)
VANLTAWHAEGPDAVLERLRASPDGLDTAEAARRLAHYGPNELPRAAPPSVALIFARQFKNPLVYLLLAATLVSLLVGELLDALFIFVVLLFNAGIGTLQEWRAQRKASELDSLVPHRAQVMRGGHWREIESARLVPGDIVRLESGSGVGADLRLLESRELLADESLLTGESLPVAKDAGAELPPDSLLAARNLPLAERRTMLFAGTTMLAGRARAAVVATGSATEIGRIAEVLAAGGAPAPPLVGQLERFSRHIGIATVVLIALVAGAQALQGTPLATVFLIAVALAVAAIPEGLPVAITVALAIATNRMQRRNVIVRSLPAVEGLGACTLIASDKTGTLTCNELTVKSLVLFDAPEPSTGDPTTVAARIEVGGEGYLPDGAVLEDGGPPGPQTAARLRELAASAALCNEAAFGLTRDGVEKLGDTVDIAFLVLAAKLGLDTAELRAGTRLLSSIPYEPERRFAAAFAAPGPAADGGAVTVHAKGAAEVLLRACPAGETDAGREAVLAEVERMAGAGYRVLAVARGTLQKLQCLEKPDQLPTDLPQGLRLLGLVGLIDPIRPEVPEAIDRCRAAGVAVRMITGDHPATALAIARQLGLADTPAQVAGGDELRLLAARPEAARGLLESKRVFARVEPIGKLDIVRGLQRLGHVVAVTGDGVNDAPALGAADIGVAMGRAGTDVARGAADLIIADDNFASIVAGIEEGRVAYDNVRKLIYLLISTGLGEILLFVLAILLGLPPPMFAVQLLWLNLVTNGIQDVALAFEKGEPDVGTRPPRPPRRPLFDRRMVAQVAFAGTYMGIIGALAYDWFLQRGLSVDEARNLVLLLMVLFENAHALNARSERLSVFRIPLAANPFLISAILGAQALHVAAMFTPGLRDVLGVAPVAFIDWVLVAALALSLIVAMEAFKRLAGRL